MRILITRPLDDARETASKLAALGHQALIAPLLHIQFADGPPISLAGVQAVLATSSNGVRALARRTPARNTALFAVGNHTAAVARACGFVDVKNAEGDGRALATATARWARPSGGALLHAAGKEEPDALAKELMSHGFSVRTLALYDAVAADVFPPVVSDALGNGKLDAVLLFSPRSARIFANCVVASSLDDACRDLTACCISSAAAAPLSRLAFKAVRVASHPDQDSLLSLLDGSPEPARP